MYWLGETFKRIVIWALSHIFIATLQLRFIFVLGDFSDNFAWRSLLFL
jgi:hypothetical protein